MPHACVGMRPFLSRLISPAPLQGREMIPPLNRPRLDYISPDTAVEMEKRLGGADVRLSATNQRWFDTEQRWFDTNECSFVADEASLAVNERCVAVNERSFAAKKRSIAANPRSFGADAWCISLLRELIIFERRGFRFENAGCHAIAPFSNASSRSFEEDGPSGSIFRRYDGHDPRHGTLAERSFGPRDPPRRAQERPWAEAFLLATKLS